MKLSSPLPLIIASIYFQMLYETMKLGKMKLWHDETCQNYHILILVCKNQIWTVKQSLYELETFLAN